MSDEVNLSSLNEALNILLFGMRKKERFKLVDGAFYVETQNGISVITALKDILSEWPVLKCEPIDGKNYALKVRFEPDLSKPEKPQEQCDRLAEKIKHFTVNNILGNLTREVREAVQAANSQIAYIETQFPRLADILRQEMVSALQGDKTKSTSNGVKVAEGVSLA